MTGGSAKNASPSGEEHPAGRCRIPAQERRGAFAEHGPVSHGFSRARGRAQESSAIESLCVVEQQLLANPNFKLPAWVLKQRQAAYKVCEQCSAVQCSAVQCSAL